AKLLEIPHDALRLALDAGEVIADPIEGRDCIFLADLDRAERSIADRVRSLLRGPVPWKPIDAGKAIPWVEARTGLILADSQKAAIRVALQSKVMVITGGPWRWKDDAGQFHPAHSRSQKRPPVFVCANRTRGEALDRDDGT